jgi:hypothetical protein
MSKIADALIKTLLFEKVTVIHAAFENTSHKFLEVIHTSDRLPSDPACPRSVEVASIDMEKTLTTDEKLEKAYVLTNTIDNAWWKNKNVTKLFKGTSCRSTSPGDMVIIGKDTFKCESTGWSKI